MFRLAPMKFQDLIDHYGSQQKVADALGISKQLASYWKRAGIPLGRQYEIQILTGGKFRADPAHRTSSGEAAA
jgi:transcriptional repressor of cell division inhibition gene dicB